MADLVSLSTSELRDGMIVANHGMRIRLSEGFSYGDPNHVHGEAYHFTGEVLNLAEIQDPWIVGMARGSVTHAAANGRTLDMEAEWGIQGNDLATWWVEMDSIAGASTVPPTRRPGS